MYVVGVMIYLLNILKCFIIILNVYTNYIFVNVSDNKVLDVI